MCYGYQMSTIPPQGYMMQQQLAAMGYSPTVCHMYYDVWKMAEVERLRDRKENLQAEAYSQIINDGSRLCVVDKRGQRHVIFDAIIDVVLYFHPQEPYSVKPYYLIGIRNVPEPIFISEDDCRRRGNLISVLSRATNKPVCYYVSELRTADLLRQYLDSISTDMSPLFYWGWRKTDEQWQYQLYQGTTHKRRRQVSLPVSVPDDHSAELTPTSELIAAEQFASLLETISAPDIRAILCLWLHAAVLSTPLEDLGHRIPLGLCFFSSDACVQRHLEALLNWYGDITISLDTPFESFVDQLIERKDQPLVLLDCCSSKKNIDMLSMVISSGRIIHENNKEDINVPLVSTLTLLSNSVTNLNTSSLFATIDVGEQDLTKCSSERLVGLSRYLPEYLRGFTAFTAGHIEDLLKFISHGMDTAAELGEDINYEGMKTLGILLGIQDLVHSYYDQLSPNGQLAPRLDSLLSQDWLPLLHNALCHAAASGSDTSDLVGQFCNVFHRMLDLHRFDISQMCLTEATGSGSTETIGTLYADETSINFTRKAFRAVCRACNVSSPVLLKALREANLLHGATINGSTFQTRITVYDCYGRSHVKRVYQFDRMDLDL